MMMMMTKWHEEERDGAEWLELKKGREEGRR